MCGIVFYSGHNQYHSNLDTALGSLHHRGPDSKNSICFNNGTIGLGHARLSIVDLEGGVQPLSSPDGKVTAIVNGEFYDYQNIRKQFEIEGYQFKTHSDSEILIPLYLKYGLDLFTHLIGEFSFVLYDQTENKVIAARDRFGIKPLYYHNRNGEIFIASEIKALLPFGIEPKWNTEAVLFSDFFIPSQNQSFFKNINAVKPGHFIVLQDGTFTEHLYWDIKYEEKSEKHDENDLICQYRKHLQQAVKSRLHGDVPIASYLSGGLDSSAILSIASEISRSPISAFSIQFDHSDYDESELARETAKFLNVSHNIVEVNDSILADHFEKAIYHNEGLIYNNQSVAKFALSKAVNKAGFKVVLTGEGADETLAGYSFFRSDLIKHTYSNEEQHRVFKKLLKMNQSTAHVFLSNTESDLLKEIEPQLGYVPSMWSVGAKYGKTYIENIYSDSFRSTINKRNVFLEFVESLTNKNLFKTNPVNRSLYLWSKTNLPEVILNFLGDRMEMAHSVEGRLPFLDHRLAQFSQNLPLHMKIKNLTEKYILRESVKGQIPSDVYERQKFPFSAPPVLQGSITKQSKIAQLLLDKIHSKNMSSIPFYSQKKLLSFIEKIRKLDPEEQKFADPIIIRAASAVTMHESFSMTT